MLNLYLETFYIPQTDKSSTGLYKSGVLKLIRWPNSSSADSSIVLTGESQSVEDKFGYIIQANELHVPISDGSFVSNGYFIPCINSAIVNKTAS